MQAGNPLLEDDTLPAIPVLDMRAAGPVREALDMPERLAALREACLTSLPSPVQSVLPVLDLLARRWLTRSASPYLSEVESIAAAVPYSGVWFLNGSYCWGCTTLAREEAGVPWLVRTLDWPFAGLGRFVELARMRGAAGEFQSLTWPGYVGCLTAMAPGRFAAALNQAPMWRRTKHPWLRPYDVALNALATWRISFAPPDHLLRDVFEHAVNFSEARRRLESTPVARPVIYTLVGCAPGERCVIERTEHSFATRSEETGAANDWLRSAPAWEARIRPDLLFTRSYEEAAENSRVRRMQLAAWPGRIAPGGFHWVKPPVLNPCTRLAAEMCPASGTLRARGYEKPPAKELAEPATRTCEVAPVA
ncbi:MAG TPA: hypothetical protein VH684_19815 [Xanthobacteraceae bacterium]